MKQITQADHDRITYPTAASAVEMVQRDEHSSNLRLSFPRSTLTFPPLWWSAMSFSFGFDQLSGRASDGQAGERADERAQQ